MPGPAIAGAAAIAVPLVMSLGVALAASASGATADSPAASVTSCGTSPVAAGHPAGGVTLDSAQLGNAQIIYDVSVTMNLPQQAAVIAEATALQESRLVNLPDGTSDSLGLFQQRPSQGWGIPAQIMQPVYAATAFYTALLKVPGWQTLPLTATAQAVQNSAHPTAYAQWEPLASSLVATFSGTADDCLTGDGDGDGVNLAGLPQLPKGFALPPGTPAAVITAIRYATAQLGKPYVYGATGPAGFDCSGLVMMAYQAAGISIPRTTYEQVSAGTPVYSLASLQPGDLLFTPGADGTPDNPGHVGMYLGDGLVIAAPHTGADIQIQPLQGYWQQSTVAIRRIA